MGPNQDITSAIGSTDDRSVMSILRFILPLGPSSYLIAQ